VLLRAENRIVGELKAAVSHNTDVIIKELDARLDSARELISKCADDHRWSPGMALGEVALISGDLAALTVLLPDAIKAEEDEERVPSALFGPLPSRPRSRLPAGARQLPLLLPTDIADHDPAEPLGLSPTLSIEGVITAYRTGSAVLKVPTSSDLDNAI